MNNLPGRPTVYARLRRIGPDSRKILADLLKNTFVDFPGVDRWQPAAAVPA